jgi:transposase
MHCYLIVTWAPEKEKEASMASEQLPNRQLRTNGNQTRSIEAHVIHASSVAVSREHRRAKTDRLDTELLKRAFLGWLRGERDHCKMVAIPTSKDEDAKRPNRERESLVGEQTRIVNRMS